MSLFGILVVRQNLMFYSGVGSEKDDNYPWKGLPMRRVKTDAWRPPPVSKNDLGVVTSLVAAERE